MSEGRRQTPSQLYSLQFRIDAWEDAGRMCHYCDRKIPRPGTKGGYATHFDHIVPVSKGGGHDKSNLILSCKVCNREKGKKDYRDFLAWKKQQLETAAKRISDLLATQE